MQGSIAWRNAKHSAKDYRIYFLTVVVSLSLMYAFNLLIFSREIMSFSGQMNALTSVIIGISVVIVLVIGWLIHYMAKYMLEKRSMEFGTYMLLGIPNEKIASLYIRENLIMGAAAFCAALAAGSFLYQILALIIVNLFQATYQIRLFYSWKAVGLTLVYVFLMYGNSMIRMRHYLNKAEVGELLYIQRQVEKDKKGKKKHRRSFWIYLVLEIFSGSVFYLACHKGMEWDYSGNLFFLSLGGILLGLYGIYTTLTAVLSGTLLENDWFKYKKDRLFLLRGMTAKFSSIGKTLGTLAILLTLTLAATQLGVLFERFFAAQIQGVTGFDVTVSTQGEAAQMERLKEYVEETYGITYEREYPLYLDKESLLYEWIGADGYIEGTPVLKYSDFKELWKALGYEPVSLEKGKYLLIGASKTAEDFKKKGMPPLEIGGEKLEIQTVLTEPFNISSGFHGTGYVAVAEDALAGTLPVYHTCLAMETKEAVTNGATEYMTELAYGDYQAGTDSFGTNAAVEAAKTSSVVIFAFALFYIGLIFACTAATILAVQQLGDASRYKFRYDILSKLGMDDEKRSWLILKQISLYFLVPVCIPIPLSIFITLQINHLILNSLVTGRIFIMACGISVGLFLLIYLLYFAAAYLGYRNKILEED